MAKLGEGRAGDHGANSADTSVGAHASNWQIGDAHPDAAAVGFDEAANGAIVDEASRKQAMPPIRSSYRDG